jgi:BirA family transcriptional regulator, biotin operon repressor / biotin---[acetyl-CoA-carboxylase] ligase
MADAFLDADAIRAASFIRHVEIHEEIGSTNDRAAELARDPHIELPALVVAHLQTAGRGRGTNKWWSADGALTFSILLDPAALGINIADWPQLSLVTAIAVCDALTLEFDSQSAISNPQSPRLAIKWPNDVMLDNRKICGILIESPGGAAPAKDRLIIGIGINVNNSWQKPDSAACGLARLCEKPPDAIALCHYTNHPHNLQLLLCNALRALETRITQLVAHDPQLPATWQQLC